MSEMGHTITNATLPAKPGLLGGIGIRQVRLTCGLILFAYLLSHFLNHALGNVSYAAMEAALRYHMAWWRNPVVTFVLYTAGIVHWSLGLWALYERRQFRYKAPELTQLLLGISIPFLLVVHFVGARLQAPLFGRDIYYAQALTAYWVNRPYMEWVQFALLLVAWTHGCIGLYFWLRLKQIFRYAAPYLLAAAVLIPVLAMLGLVEGAREVIAFSRNPEWRAANLSAVRFASPEQRIILDAITAYFPVAYATVIALVLGARGVRTARERRGATVSLTYPGGKMVSIPKGMTVLEASLRHGVPHTSVCGGKARCSTCRIRIIGDVSRLPLPSRREAFVLDRVGAGSDPTVRLACQLRPSHDITFVLVFPPQTVASDVPQPKILRTGEERYVVSMFVDMRDSTKIIEKQLPFDTMFLINRFVEAVSSGVEEAGGRPNQFVGDGVLALFGLDRPPETACRDAIAAVGYIAANVERLNKDLAGHSRQPIAYGVGINAGEAIVGDIGYRDHVVFTALGDSVNVAARLQEMTKELACEVIVADEVCRTAGLPSDLLPTRKVSIRGRDDHLTIRIAGAARLLTMSNASI